MSQPPNPTKKRILEFLVTIFVALAAVVFIQYLANNGLLPESYVLPIYAIIVLIAGYVVIMIVSRAVERIVEPAFGAVHMHGVKHLFQLVAGIILIVAVFALFGINITAALISAGFIGIVLGLAAQQVLGNMFAGLSLLVSKPFEIGDRVSLVTSSYGLTGSTYSHESEPSGIAGVVQDVGILFTRILLDNGTPAIFPNSAVITSLVLNYSKMVSRNVRIRIDLDKKTSYENFKNLLLASLKKYDILEADKSRVEIVDIAASTYQVAVSVSAKGDSNESVKTLLIRECMKAQEATSGEAAT